MPAHSPLGWAPLASPEISTVAPPGQHIPPPVPGGTTQFTYDGQTGVWPLAFGGLAGGGPQAAYPGGGIVLVPQPDDGVMQVLVWWPDATGLQLARIGPDGTRTPVRGGYPAPVDQATRHNYATNPSAEAGLNGFVPADGNPNLSNLPL